LNAYQPPLGWNKRRQEAETASEEVAMFVQTRNRGGNSWKLRQTCYKCEERGHTAGECPLKEEKQDQMHGTIKEEEVMDKEDIDEGENIFVEKKEGGVVDKKWVLLVCQSTINQVSNPAMLTNIRRAKIRRG
jgi:hypothetical protein